LKKESSFFLGMEKPFWFRAPRRNSCALLALAAIGKGQQELGIQVAQCRESTQLIQRGVPLDEMFPPFPVC
jgi:hypothetical protein